MHPLLAAADAEKNASLAGFIVLAVGGLGLAVWAAVIARLRKGEPLLTLSPRRPVPWNWLLTLAAFIFYFTLATAGVVVAQVVATGTVSKLDIESPETLMMLLLASSAASVLSTLLTVVTLIGFARATKIDLGFDARTFGQDIMLGVMGFLAVAPVVYLIKWLLLPLSPKNHPLEQIVRENPTPGLLAATVVVAVIVAPWVEEVLLRVVFQGWLERCFFRDVPRPLVQPADVVEAALVVEEPDSAPLTQQAMSNPYVASARWVEPLPFQDPDSDLAGDQTVPRGWLAAAPILISSAVFALMHVGHGVDPIPLFFLAMVLGWLYQRTHRLWPCVALHASLNGVSVVLLFLSL